MLNYEENICKKVYEGSMFLIYEELFSIIMKITIAFMKNGQESEIEKLSSTSKYMKNVQRHWESRGTN